MQNDKNQFVTLCLTIDYCWFISWKKTNHNACPEKWLKLFYNHIDCLVEEKNVCNSKKRWNTLFVRIFKKFGHWWNYKSLTLERLYKPYKSRNQKNAKIRKKSHHQWFVTFEFLLHQNFARFLFFFYATRWREAATHKYRFNDAT